MPTRHPRRASILLLAFVVLGMPLPALAADPTLGEAVTLPDGTVLPPMPAEQITPTAQSEMLAENGVTPIADGGLSVQAASPLIVAEAAFAGPAGPLPNQLTHEVLGFLPYWKLDTATRGYYSGRLKLAAGTVILALGWGVALASHYGLDRLF